MSIFFKLFVKNIALDNILINRWDAQAFARKAYDSGIRYIGGCCGFEPHHIRAMAEEVGMGIVL